MNLKIKNLITSSLLIAATSLIITGCSSLSQPSKPKTINVKITHSGKCQIGNKIIPVAKISKGVKSAGGRRNSHIAITVPKDMDYATVKEAIRRLAKSGYMKVHLQNPREAVSYINEKK